MTRYKVWTIALGLALAAAVQAGGQAGAQEDEYAAVRDKIEACFSCHGVNGASQDPQFPIIAGQHLHYLYVQLKDFGSGRRISPMMTEIVAGSRIAENVAASAQAGRPDTSAPAEAAGDLRIKEQPAETSRPAPAEPPVMTDVATGLTKAEMLTIAKFFSEQEWPNIAYTADPDEAGKGETATVAGQCVQCHRGGYEGDSRIPRLGGQYPAYLKKTMLDFKSKERNNSPAKSSLMASYSAGDLAAMAEYLGEM